MERDILHSELVLGGWSPKAGRMVAKASATHACGGQTQVQPLDGKSYADVVVVRAKHVTLKAADNIAFKKYRSPPNFDRGLCRACGKPVVEIMGAGPFKVMFIPASNFETESQLPAIKMDIFYHRRVSDMPDNLPKYRGYWSSELAVGKLIAMAI